MIISILNLFFRSNASTSTLLSDNELEEILKVHSEENLHTTHSEIVKPVHIPVFQVRFIESCQIYWLVKFQKSLPESSSASPSSSTRCCSSIRLVKLKSYFFQHKSLTSWLFSIPIPQPYPKYIAVKHPVRIPVYKIVPEIVEKPVHYIVEKPLPSITIKIL